MLDDHTGDQSAPDVGPPTFHLLSAAVFLLAVALAAFLRFYLIGIKPLHHDEGVNSHFLLALYNQGQYTYNPENYHGPTLYYFALVSLYGLGKTELALRFWPALWGLLSVLSLWPLRRRLGQVGTPVAALLIALSPGLVYFSRDFIHESSFGFFSLAMVVCAWCYVETKRFLYLALLAASAGLLFATKETAIITAVVIVLAAICAEVWDLGRQLIAEHRFSVGTLLREIWREWRDAWPRFDPLLAAIVIFLFINVVFYSSIFTHWEGVLDAGKSVLMWTKRGVTEHIHDHAYHYYLGLLFKLELPLLVGTLLGIIVALWRGTRFGLFLMAWTIGIILGYSLIPYKTPWLIVSMLVPCALLSGYAAQKISALLRSDSLRMIGAALLIAILIPCGRLAWRVNFEKPDDNDNKSGYFVPLGERLKLMAYTNGQYGGYVYAQTDKDILNLVRAIDEAAERRLTGKSTGIYIASTDYWPLPWYLRDYTGVAYVGSLPVDGQSNSMAQPIIIGEDDEQEAIEKMIGPNFQSSTFILRPGVNLILYVRE